MDPEITSLLPDTAKTNNKPQVVRPISMATKVLCYGVLPGAAVALFVVSPLTGCLLPMILLPSAWLAYRETQVEQGRRVNFEVALWTFVMTGTVGMAVTGTIQSIMTYAFGLLLLGSDAEKYLTEWTRSAAGTVDPADRAVRMEMSKTWQNWILIAFMSFDMAGILEEGLKLAGLLFARRYTKLSYDRHYVAYAVAAAAGFMTSETTAFIFVDSQTQDKWRLARTVVERVALGPVMHLSLAALIGINYMRRHHRKENIASWQVLFLPVLLHGLFDFVMMSASALDGNVGWVHPEGGLPLTLVLVGGGSVLVVLVSLVQYRVRRYLVD